jgi:hypothetical protein
MQFYTGSYVSDNQIGAILALLNLRRVVTTDRQPWPIALIHGRFREPVIRNNLDQEIMIEGHRVPNSLAATTMPEPYRLGPAASLHGRHVGGIWRCRGRRGPCRTVRNW